MTQEAPQRPVFAQPPAPGNARLQTRISLILTSGLAAACLVSLAGGLLVLVQRRAETVDPASFLVDDHRPRTVVGILRAALSPLTGGPFDAGAVAMLGALLLIATPVARVALSLFAFALERDRLYVAVSAIVLAMLLLSFALGV